MHWIELSSIQCNSTPVDVNSTHFKKASNRGIWCNSKTHWIALNASNLTLKALNCVELKSTHFICIKHTCLILKKKKETISSKVLIFELIEKIFKCDDFVFGASLRCTKHNELQFNAIRRLFALHQRNSKGVEFGIELIIRIRITKFNSKLNCFELELYSSNSPKRSRIA